MTKLTIWTFWWRYHLIIQLKLLLLLYHHLGLRHAHYDAFLLLSNGASAVPIVSHCNQSTDSNVSGGCPSVVIVEPAFFSSFSALLSAARPLLVSPTAVGGCPVINRTARYHRWWYNSPKQSKRNKTRKIPFIRHGITTIINLFCLIIIFINIQITANSTIRTVVGGSFIQISITTAAADKACTCCGNFIVTCCRRVAIDHKWNWYGCFCWVRCVE